MGSELCSSSRVPEWWSCFTEPGGQDGEEAGWWHRFITAAFLGHRIAARLRLQVSGPTQLPPGPMSWLQQVAWGHVQASQGGPQGWRSPTTSGHHLAVVSQDNIVFVPRQASAIHSQNLGQEQPADTWALCQLVVSVYQTKFPPSFAVFHPVLSVNIYFNLLSKTGTGKLFITIADESTYFVHLLPLVKALKWGCYLSRT